MERLTLRDDDGRALLTPYGLRIYSSTQATADCICKLEEALKAQEPRLVTESDFDGADEFGYIPVWTEEKDGDMYWECIPKTAITDPDGIEVLRYWTSRTDQATREATPWER